ncbi:hypothetical protein SALBM311S_03170 [Streptomyces alboniger]
MPSHPHTGRHHEESATLALGVEVHLTSPLAVHAPWVGTVTRHAEHGVTLTAGGLHLVLDGINPADAVIDGGEAVSGQQLGTVAAQGSWYRLDVQLSRLGTGIAPRFTPPGLDAGWLTMCPDPTGLILPRADRPVADTPTESESVLLERRVKSSPPCRSTTSKRLRRSSEAGSTTWWTPAAAATWTCSTT